MSVPTRIPERLDVPGRIPKSKEECEHLARYLWATRRVRGDILDLACGTGYGAKLLARVATVTGVDRDERAVALARARARGTFVVAEVPPIPLPAASFDAAVCFETVEHVPDDLDLIREFRRVLRSTGQLLISTPNAEVSAPGGQSSNQWHVREYTLASLSALLVDGGFEISAVFGQSFAPKLPRGHRLAWRLNGLTWVLPGVVGRSLRLVLGDAQVTPHSVGGTAPGFWLAVATPTARRT